jgi:chemotaxis response regulator CheB
MPRGVNVLAQDLYSTLPRNKEPWHGRTRGSTTVTAGLESRAGPIAGIGASAGGLESLEQLFARVLCDAFAVDRGQIVTRARP